MKTFFNILVFLFGNLAFYGQTIGINSTGAVADNSAMLDVVSADKGLLIPRLDIADLTTAAPVTAPATSLLVYNTNVTSGLGYHYWDGTKWTKLTDTNTNSDEDWHEVGGTTAPDDINDDIFTQGNVGIGTTNPGSKLFIKQATDDTPASSLRVENSGGTAGSLLTITSDNKTYIGAQNAFDGPGSNVDNGIYISNNTGNVGIGTINPSSRLELKGSTESLARLIINNEGLVPNASNVDFNSNGGVVAKIRSYTSDDINGNLEFWTEEATVLSQKMVVLGNGNVGIGETAPVAPLDFGNLQLNKGNGNASIASDVFMTGQGLIASENHLYINSDANATGTGDVRFCVGTETTAATRLVTIKNGGNVGIGVNGPAYQLELSTNSAAKPGSNTWTIASDRRLKDNVRKFNSGLSDVLKIDPVWYTYNGKAGMPKETYVGVIAQDLQKIAPYMVGEWTYENEDNGKKENYLDVNNGAMTYMLINAVKELKAENDFLKERIEKLENR